MDLNSLPPRQSAQHSSKFRPSRSLPERRERKQRPPHPNGPANNSQAGRQDLEQLNTAIKILELEIENQTGSKHEVAEMEFLLSCCFTELFDALQFSDRATANKYRERSQEILTRLVELQPNRTAYRFQLMQSQAEINVFMNRIGLEQLSKARQRLVKALGHGKMLAESRPAVPKYQIALNHVNFKLATVLQRMGEHKQVSKNFESAKFHFRESKLYFENAIAGQASCVKKQEVVSQRAWLGRMLLNFAASSCKLSKRERLELANQAIEEIETVNRARSVDRLLDEAQRLQKRIADSDEQN